jgi:hypothetical protein
MSSRSALFWDVENVPVPNGVSGTRFFLALCDYVQMHGPFSRIVAAADVGKKYPMVSRQVRSELVRCGVSVIDVDHESRKNVVDATLVAQIFAFALDTPPPATIVLVAGDIDYAMALSVLRTRNYTIVLVTPSNIPIRCELVDVAHHTYDISAILSSAATSEGVDLRPDTRTAKRETDPQRTFAHTLDLPEEFLLESFLNIVLREDRELPLYLSFVGTELYKRHGSLLRGTTKRIALRAQSLGYVAIDNSADGNIVVSLRPTKSR